MGNPQGFPGLCLCLFLLLFPLGSPLTQLPARQIPGRFCCLSLRCIEDLLQGAFCFLFPLQLLQHQRELHLRLRTFVLCEPECRLFKVLLNTRTAGVPHSQVIRRLAVAQVRCVHHPLECRLWICLIFVHAARQIGAEFVVGLRMGQPGRFLQRPALLPEIVHIRISLCHVHEVPGTDLLRRRHRFLRVVFPGCLQVSRFCRWFVPDIELFLQHPPGFGRGGFCHGVFRQIEGRLTVPQFLLHQHALDQRLDRVILGQPVIGLFQVLFGTDAIAVPAAEVIGCLGTAQVGGFLHVAEGFLFVFFRFMHAARQISPHLVMGFGV